MRQARRIGRHRSGGAVAAAVVAACLACAGCLGDRHLAPGAGASYQAVFQAHAGAAKADAKKRPAPLGTAEARGIHGGYVASFGAPGAAATAAKDDSAAWNTLLQQAQGPPKGGSVQLGP